MPAPPGHLPHTKRLKRWQKGRVAPQCHGHCGDQREAPNRAQRKRKRPKGHSVGLQRTISAVPFCSENSGCAPLTTLKGSTVKLQPKDSHRDSANKLEALR